MTETPIPVHGIGDPVGVPEPKVVPEGLETDALDAVSDTDIPNVSQGSTALEAKPSGLRVLTHCLCFLAVLGAGMQYILYNLLEMFPVSPSVYMGVEIGMWIGVVVVASLLGRETSKGSAPGNGSIDPNAAEFNGFGRYGAALHVGAHGS